MHRGSSVHLERLIFKLLEFTPMMAHEFAHLDLERAQRTGTHETIYCPGKNNEQLLEICARFHAAGKHVLASRCSAEQYAYLLSSSSDIPLEYDACSRILLVGTRSEAPACMGRLAVCTGGTADIPFAEEAAQVAEFYGVDVHRYYDIGVAGIHRLLNRIDEIRQADVVISVAGMEGALPSVIAGLVSAPVIALPTSVGYGASFQGLSPLLTMLNSCAEGISVVNIDNGYGAGVLAYRMLSIHQNKS